MIARSRLIGVLLVSLLALAIGALVPLPAHAGTATLTWTAPTQRTDGSALSNLASYRIYRGTSAAALTTTFTVAAPATTYTDATAPSGTVFYAITAIDANGVESARTAAVSVAIPDANPNPPTGLTVVAVVAGLNMNPVYRINADGTRGAAVLGFVPVGSACNGAAVYTYRGRSYHRVDPALVRWEKTTPTPNAATACAIS